MFSGTGHRIIESCFRNMQKPPEGLNEGLIYFYKEIGERYHVRVFHILCLCDAHRQSIKYKV